MLVIDCGGPFIPPDATATSVDGNIVLNDGDSLFLTQNDFNGEEEFCLNVAVTDENVNFAPFSESISVEIEALNFNGDLTGLISPLSGIITREDPELNVEFCIPKCPFLEDMPLLVEFRFQDGTCPLPLIDTFNLVIDVEPPVNSPPRWINTVKEVKDTIRLGEVYSTLNLFGRDADLDSMTLEVLTDDFETGDFNIRLDTIAYEGGRFDIRFFWDTDCENENMFTIDNDFHFEFLLSDSIDNRNCGFEPPDTLILDLHIILPDNNTPNIWTSLNEENTSLRVLAVTGEVFNDLNFNIIASDVDGDSVRITGFYVDADSNIQELASLGISFSKASADSTVISPLLWPIPCDIFNEFPDGSVDLNFVAEDIDICNINDNDTVTVQVDINPPPNSEPVLSAEMEGSIFSDSLFTSVAVGETLNIELLGSDADPIDILNLSAEIPDSLSQFIEFENVQGQGSVASEFIFHADCDLFFSGNGELEITIPFVLSDNYCVRSQQDIFNLILSVKREDVPLESQVIPNIFTPGPDTYNRFFRLENPEIQSCEFRFRKVQVFDRWGKMVFEDDSPEFKWSGDDVATGVYFYSIEYTNDLTYSGWVHLIRDE
jgi:gliding motility-associated-like protein